MDDQNTIDPTTIPAAAAPTETQTTGSTSGSSQTVMTPADKAAIQGQFAANTNAANLQEQVGGAEADKSTQLADVQGEDADLYRQQAADAAAEHQFNLDRIEKARGQQQEAEDALKDHKFENYWSKQSTGHKVLQALGSLATGFSGNQAAMNALNQQTQDLVKQDFDQQRAEYAQKLDEARMKGADVNDLYSQWEREMGASKVKEAKAHEAIAAKALEVGTRAGIPVDQLKNSVLVQNLIANANQKRLESQLHFDRTNRFESSRNTSETTQKDAKGANAKQLEADAELADLIPDAQALTKTPLTADEMKVLIRRLNPPKDTGIGSTIAHKVGDWMEPSLDPDALKRVETAQRLVGRLNPLVGEKRTPDSDIAVAMSRLPTADDKDTTKADRLLQTIRAQAYRTTNPSAFARAAGAPQTPFSMPAGTPPPATTNPQTIARARAAMNDPNASPAAKMAAARILSGG
jgi:hypothetical protein